MNPKKDLINMLFWGVLFIAISATVVLCSRPKAGSLPPVNALTEKELHVDRQVLWIRVDSLRTLLDPLQVQTNAFTWVDEGRKLVFEPIQTSTFQEIFLDNQALSVYNDLKNPIIKPLKNGLGFEAMVKEENKMRMVQLPAEVVQSIQFFIENNITKL